MTKTRNEGFYQVMKAFLFCLVIPFTSFGNSSLDSLILATESMVDSEQKINNYEALCDALFYDHPDSSLYYIQKGYRIAERLESKKGLAITSSWLGYIYDGVYSILDSSIHYYSISLETYEELGVCQKVIDQQINMGAAYIFASEYGKAIQVFMDALIRAEEMGSLQLRSEILINLGVAHRKMNAEGAAIKVYREAIGIQQQLKDTSLLAKTYLNIGVAYGKIDKKELAIRNLQKAKGLYTEVGDTAEAASVDLAIGMAYMDLGDFRKARVIMENVVLQHQDLLDDFDISRYHLFKGQLDQMEGRSQSALDHLLKGYSIIGQTDQIDLKAAYKEAIAQAYASIGEYEKSYEFLQQYAAMKDSINDQKRMDLEQEMRIRFDTERKEEEILQQNRLLKQKKRSQKLLIALACTLGFLLLLASLLVRNRIRANKELNRKNQVIAEALDQKETLLREIHHRVKNNLQIISSLLSLQSHQIKDESALAAISEGRNRVKSMALIHQNLYQDSNLVGVKVKDYIEKLTDSLISSYKFTADVIDVQKEIDDLELDVDAIIPLGLVLNELISNALKYAFDGDKKGRLQISLRKSKKVLSLQVKDNGKGMPPDFQIDQAGSMGYRIIQSFSKKLKAQLMIQNDNGADVTLRIPIDSIRSKNQNNLYESPKHQRA